MGGGCRTVDYGIRWWIERITDGKHRGRTVSKAMPLLGLILSGLIGILFLADLAAGFPFRRVSVGLDVCFVVACVILAYLSWTLLEKARA